MANKTQPTAASVTEFLDSVAHPARRADAYAIAELMEELSGCPPVLWGSNLVGFGTYAFKYASGRAGEWFRVGFSPRKARLTLYVMPGLARYEELLARLGKHKNGKSCLHVNRLSDVDMDVVRELIVASLELMEERYGAQVESIVSS